MDTHAFLAQQFEAERPRLQAVAYRMLGSLAEAEDAVQEAWLNLSRCDTSTISNLGGWLTTVIARVCLNMLHARASRREESLEASVPQAVMGGERGIDPEQEMELADSVGLALLVVLDTLAPAERLAFVLHDIFAVPFDEIAPLVERSEAAARQLASRARRRVRGRASMQDTDLAASREVVEAFLTAAREGSFDALLAVLDPDVVVRIDAQAGPAGVPREMHGAAVVANQLVGHAQIFRACRAALVDGS
ncbi:MAG TPA: sigma-70 family RNA polymerase sigma factor, partial [Ktedonosporobacter sp.]|nr:sigma-70 family RNA polymerase sigma factor [Ktedonosporobacter sp.]